MIQRISPVDAFFLLAEQERMPLHAGGLMELTKPADAGPDFVPDLKERMRGPWRPASPFDLVPLPGPIGRTPALRSVPTVEVDAHVHVHRLPAPGGQRELGALVARLHAELLPRDRPLWEMHLIDGLDDRAVDGADRFAIYTKIHHALIDGVSGMRRLVRWLSPDPDARGAWPPFTIGPPSAPARALTSQAGALVAEALRLPLTAVGAARDSAVGVLQVGEYLLDLSRGEIDGQPLAAPYQPASGLFRGRITAERRLVSCQLPLGEVRRAAKASGGTVNDIVLWLVSSSLRDYLAGRRRLPEESLMAGCAVNLRAGDDDHFGNAFGFLSVDLATTTADPLDRLRRIQASSGIAKRQLRAMTPTALALQTVVAQAPLVGSLLLGLGSLTPSAYAVAVSNVPGPREQLYLEGARLDSLVPVSIPVDSNPLNVTCVSHGDRLTFGITAAAASVPQLQLMGAAMSAGWQELRTALAL